MVQWFSGVIVTRHGPKIQRRAEDEGGRCVGKLQFLQVEPELGLLFRLLALDDLEAERAGMVAVEGAFNRLDQRTFLQVIRQHLRPGNGLQHQPMRAGRHQQRNNQ